MVAMVQLKLIVEKFGQKGEKSGWTYLAISAAIAQKINKGVKTLYKVKGKINGIPFAQTNLVPMGGGDYILALNAELRRKIKVAVGEVVNVEIEVDSTIYTFNEDLIHCLQEDKNAFDYFSQLAPGHQRYFSKWIDAAKTLETQSKRIAAVLRALNLKQDYGQMIRSQKENNIR